MIVKTRFGSKAEALAFKQARRDRARTAPGPKSKKRDTSPLANTGYDFAAYGARNQNLIDIGYKTYADYLASDLWLVIKKRFLGSRKCLLCSTRKASVLHHISYSCDVLRNGSDKFLTPLCHKCHGHIETLGGRGKATLDQANKELFRLLSMQLSKRLSQMR